MRGMWAFTAALLLVSSAPASPQQPSRTETPRSPEVPITWTCPMHPDVVEAATGTCAICRMNLVAIRLDTIWTCPRHAAIVEHKPGSCPIDHQDLVQTTVSVSYTCPGRSDISQLSPGTCPDGTPTTVSYTPRPHGNHNPQHGGQFFMAADNWHHLEGAYPRAGVIRIYLYDDFTRPLAIDQARRVTGRIVTKESFDAATRATTEHASFPLKLAPGGQYLETRVDTRTAPATVVAKVKFKNDGPEYRFDFTFPAYTKDPRPPSTRAAAVTPSPQPAAPAESAPAASVDPSQIPLPIPDSVGDMVAQLVVRDGQIRDLIARGALAEVFVPAFQAKDLALALDEHRAQMPATARASIESALTRLVESAWLLDALGDLGNRQQVGEAYEQFSAAVRDVQAIVR